MTQYVQNITNEIFLGDGLGGFTRATNTGIEAGPADSPREYDDSQTHDLILVDVNNDNALDVITANDWGCNGGDAGSNQVFLNNNDGSGTFTEVANPGIGRGAMSIVAGDVNHGKNDCSSKPRRPPQPTRALSVPCLCACSRRRLC